MSLQPITILGYDNRGGFQNNKKPFLIPETAFQRLENSYAWRDRLKKREGLKFLGRLQRILTSESLGVTIAGPPNFITLNVLSSIGVAGIITNATQALNCQITSPNHNLVNGDTITIFNVVGMTELNGNTFTITVVGPDDFTIGVNSLIFGAYVSGGNWVNTTEPNAQLTPGSVVIMVGAPDTATFTDNGDGTFTVTGAGVAAGSFVNYATGEAVLQFSGLVGGAAITVDFNYFPGLPVMAIDQREIASINDEQTIYFDTKFAYIWNGAAFQEFIPGTTWNGSDSDFFWSTNFRGINPEDRLFFTTNFFNNAGSPIRYTNGVTWTDFTPVVAGTEAIDISIGSIEGNGTLFIGTLPNAPIVAGSVEITVAGITFTDPTGSGTLTGNPVTNTGTINYSTGAITLNFNPTILFSGTITNITTAPNAQVTTTVPHNLTTGAQLTITGMIGTNPNEINNKNFTITVTGANTFLLNSAYTGVYASGGAWSLNNAGTTVLASYSGGTNFLFQARIIIPYFGRLLALNVWEGSSVAASVNIFNRCRFSQIGSPIQSDAWRSDIFGKGGFIDAPTNEQIINATFLNNTLIVFFEKTTWQLRYVGEYGLPFIWERIASDLGSESTFSPVLFNQNIVAIGDKAIISADSNSVQRIDLDIPDVIFTMQNANNGVKRVTGIRDYQKELVYWNYADAFTQAAPGTDVIYPNKVLIYNYRNNTWAIFRDSVTVFGTFQETADVTWDSQVIFWDSEIVTWDDFDTQSRFPLITSGNQEGFINFYQIQGPQGTSIVPANEQPSLSITGIALSGSLLTLTIKNHNLLDGEIIYLSNIQFINSTTFVPVATTLNDRLYHVQVIDPNTISLGQWSFVDQQYFNDFTYTPDITTVIYIGGGLVTLFPVPVMQTKDFNPFQIKGLQTKLSYIDFLMDVTNQPPGGAITGASKASQCVITSPNHGLISGQNIMITAVQGMTQLNTSMNYIVTVIDANSFSINLNSTNFSTYTGGGVWILLVGGLSIELFLNSSPAASGNLLVGNKELGTAGNAPFFRPFFSQASEYSWYRFYTTCAGQYFNLLMTYDDNLMNTIYTHNQNLTINAVNMWVRQGGKIVF